MLKKIMFILLLILATSCSVTEPGFGESLKGSIVLVFDNTTSRTLLPEIEMDIIKYDIICTHENGTTLSNLNLTSKSAVLFDRVLPGEWSITVNGKNDSGTIIGSGKSITDVISNQSVTVDITVAPLVGEGILDLNVSWSENAASQLENPIVESTISPLLGGSIELIMETDIDSRLSKINKILDNGYYVLSTKLKNIYQEVSDGISVTETVGGAVEIVRIVKDNTTYGKYSFDDINTDGLGEMEVIISNDMVYPLELILTSDFPDGYLLYLHENETIVLNVDLTEDLDNVYFMWFLNGTQVASGKSFKINAESYRRLSRKNTFNGRIDVIAATIDGKRAGSETYSFTVKEKIWEWNGK